MFSVIVYKKYILNVKYMHLIVWPLNILLQILPLSKGDYYGQTVDQGPSSIPLERCYLGSKKAGLYSRLYWDDIVYNYVLIASFIIIVVLSLLVTCYGFYTNSNELPDEVSNTVVLYPISMLVAYVPNCAYAIYFNNYIAKNNDLPPHGQIILTYLASLNALYGVFLSLIFYIRTKQARYEWLKIYRSIFSIDVHDLEMPLTDKSSRSIYSRHLSISSKNSKLTDFDDTT